MSASVVIDIIVNSRGAAKKMEAAVEKMDSFGNSMARLAVPAGVVMASFAGVGKKALTAASDLQQATGGMNTVFKEQAATVDQWAKDSAQSVGLAESEYKTMATGIGGALTGMGVPLDQAAQSTHDLMLRAADLASVYGGTTQDAVAAVSSAFRGEYDALQRLVPTISAKAVADQMAAEKASGLTYASEEQAKAAAITNLIMNESANAAGNFAAESDTAAGAQQRATAEFKDMAATLGQALLPTITQLMEWLAKFATWVQDNIEFVSALVKILVTASAAILAINAALSAYDAVMAVVKAGTAAWSAVTKAATAVQAAFAAATWATMWPILAIGAAIAALIAIIVLLIKNWDDVAAAATACWEWIKNVVSGFVDWIGGAVGGMIDGITSAWQGFSDWMSGLWDGIKNVAEVAWEFIKTVALGPIGWIQKALEAFGVSATDVFNWIKDVGSSVWEAIRSAAETALNFILKPIEKVKSAVDSLINKIKDAIRWAKDLAKQIPVIGRFLGKSGPAQASTPSLVVPGSSTRGARAPGGVSGGGGGITINVSGALDPVTVARQIDRLLRDQRRRTASVHV